MDAVTDKLLAEGARAKLAAEASFQTRQIMLRIAGDALLLNEVVACGPFDFRQKFLKAMKPLPVDGYVADRVYAFLEQKAGGRYAATRFMDGIEITVETEAEKAKRIEAAWTVTSHSSEAAKRQYGMPTGDMPMKLSELRGMVTITDLDVDKKNEDSPKS